MALEKPGKLGIFFSYFVATLLDDVMVVMFNDAAADAGDDVVLLCTTCSYRHGMISVDRSAGGKCTVPENAEVAGQEIPESGNCELLSIHSERELCMLAYKSPSPSVTKSYFRGWSNSGKLPRLNKNTRTHRSAGIVHENLG